MAATGRHLRSCTQRGQALVELALLTPLLLALALGVIELGRYAYIAILVGNAAHAGATYGAQSAATAADSNGIETAADNDFGGNGQDVAQLTVEGGFSRGSYVSCGCDRNGTISRQTTACSTAANPNAGTCTGGSHWVVTVSVDASGTFQSLFKYPGIPRNITVDRTATMRVAE